MNQATDRPADGDDVTVDTDKLTRPDDDLLGRIDEATSAPNGDPADGSIEAQLKLLLPGTAFVLRREHGLDSAVAESIAGFLAHITGGEVELPDVADPCSQEAVAAAWTTAGGMWAVHVGHCVGAHRHEGYQVKVTSFSAEEKMSEAGADGLTADEAITLVKLLCKKGLTYS